MDVLHQIKSLFPPKFKIALGNFFPSVYTLYERSYILNTLGLKKFYDKGTDSLHLGQAVFPLKIACYSKVLGVFNSEFPDVVYPLLPDSDGVKKIPFAEGPYELGDVKISNGDIVFDCGANMGLFSMMTGNFNCKCYAFEPMPANIERLNKLIQVNPHIVLAPYAICDKDGTIQFGNSENDSTANKISSDNDDNNSIDVDCTTLDSFVEKNKIERVDFIKADIEGAERLMLKGAQRVLREYAPKLSICTYHLPDDPQVLRELVLEANPKYKIEEKYKKMYAHVPNKAL